MFENKELGVKFSLPEPLRIRDIEKYETAKYDAQVAGSKFVLSINWVGAMALIEDWECEALPEPKKLSPKEFKDAHGPALKVIVWAATKVATHVMTELYVSKN